jgi:hypothetical protein
MSMNGGFGSSVPSSLVASGVRRSVRRKSVNKPEVIGNVELQHINAWRSSHNTRDDNLCKVKYENSAKDSLV